MKWSENSTIGRDLLNHIMFIIIGLSVGFVVSLYTTFSFLDVFQLKVFVGLVLFFSIVTSLVIHGFCKMFKGTGGYGDTFKGYTTGIFPLILTLPFLALEGYFLVVPAIALFYSFYIMSDELEILHDGTMYQALVLPYLLIIALLYYGRLLLI